LCLWLKFSVEHSFSCPKGGFPSIRHNEIRDLTAILLTEVCHEVENEPTLQLVTGKQFILATSNANDSCRLDIAANGFGEVDVKVFNATLLLIVPILLGQFIEDMK